MLLALVPPLWTAWHVAQTWVDVPFWDSWQFVHLLELDRRGEVGLADLWLSHNGHRILLPRLLMLGLARLSDWDARWEQAASLAFALASLGVLALCIRRSFRALAPGWIPWLVLVASVLTFSQSQWENWCWGWQVQILMAAFFGVLTAWLAARSQGRRRDLALMLGAATGGALCFASGLALFGVVGLALLLGPHPAARRERWIQLGCAAAAALLAAWAFLPEQQVFENLPESARGWPDPLDLAVFVCAYMGGALARTSVNQAVLLGAGGLGAVAVLGAVLPWRAPQMRGPLLPWLLLAAWSAGSGVITGIGRVGFGFEQAIVPRYATFATPLWIALACIAALAMARMLRAATANQRPLRMAQVSAIAAVTVAAGGHRLVEVNQQGLEMLYRHGEELEHGRALLLMDAAPPEDSLGMLFHDLEVREVAPRVRALGLSLFADPPAPTGLEGYERVQPERTSGQIDQITTDDRFRGCLVVMGWSVDPFGTGVPEAVLVTIDGEVVGRAAVGLPREDVRAGLGRPASFRPGWEAHLMAVPPRWKGSRLEAFALLPGDRIAPLGGERVLGGGG